MPVVSGLLFRLPNPAMTHHREDRMSIRNVYSTIASFENVMKAENDASKNKREDKEVLEFRSKYEDNIYDLVHAMRVVPPTTYRHFYLQEPKLRKVIFIDYKSKIVQRAIYNVLNPIVCKGFINDTFSCIEHRGQLSAMQRIKSWMQYAASTGRKWYYYKLDVEKFFYRMDHGVLMDIFEKKIGDKQTLYLLDHYLNHATVPFGLPLGIKSPVIPMEMMLWDVGIAIGGGLSHMEANMYMDVLDQECKRNLGIKFYIRYMDDIIILSDDKNQLHDWRDHIQEFIGDKLKLTLNDRCALRPIGQGIEFVGYRIWPNYVTLRKSTTLRMKHRLADVARQYHDHEITLHRAFQTAASYEGMLRHCDCKELKDKIWKDFILTHNDLDVMFEEDPWSELSLFWNL